METVSEQEGVTVGEMKRQMANEVYAAARRCDIMVGSVSTMWPMCAMSAFLDACDRLKPPPKQFGTPSIPSALAFRQEQYGWTQRQMAKKLGIQQSHYNEILKGKRTLPFKAACRAHALGVPAVVLLSLKNQRAVSASREQDQT